MTIRIKCKSPSSELVHEWGELSGKVRQFLLELGGKLYSTETRACGVGEMYIDVSELMTHCHMLTKTVMPENDVESETFHQLQLLNTKMSIFKKELEHLFDERVASYRLDSRMATGLWWDLTIHKDKAFIRTKEELVIPKGFGYDIFLPTCQANGVMVSRLINLHEEVDGLTIMEFDDRRVALQATKNIQLEGDTVLFSLTDKAGLPMSQLILKESEYGSENH